MSLTRAGVRLLRPQFAAPLHAFIPARLRHRYVPPPIRLQRPRVRYIPRLTYSFRVPIVVLIIVGGLAYVNYKLKELYKWITGYFSNTLDAGKRLINSASDGVKSVATQASVIKLYKGITGYSSNALDAGTHLINSASNGVKSVATRAAGMKPPKIEAPQFLKDLFPSNDTTRHDRDSSSRGW